MTFNQALHKALADGPASAATIAKAAKIETEEAEAQLEAVRRRLWVTVDDSGRTPKYELTQHGRNALDARYGPNSKFAKEQAAADDSE